MEIEAIHINTRGYEFYWNVAYHGYGVFGEADFRCPLPKQPGLDLAKYDPERLFFFHQLIKNEYRPPWLIAKRSPIFNPPAVYKPLSDPVLHRKFAKLKTANLENEVIRFADKHGLLGRTVILHSVDPGPVVNGESLRWWQKEIDKMGVMLAIWDLIRQEDAGKLGQIVIWDSPSDVSVRFKWKNQNGRYQILPWDDEQNGGHSAGSLRATDGTPQYFFERYQRGDVLGPAHDYLYDMLNHHLDGITPLLTPGSGYKISFVPKSLLDALWLTFMLEVGGTTKTCWHCGNPFDPTRRDKIYCSNNCKRMAFYYKNTGTGGKE